MKSWVPASAGTTKKNRKFQFSDGPESEKPAFQAVQDPGSPLGYGRNDEPGTERLFTDPLKSCRCPNRGACHYRRYRRPTSANQPLRGPRSGLLSTIPAPVALAAE